jgi:hypothetical protein
VSQTLRQQRCIRIQEKHEGFGAAAQANVAGAGEAQILGIWDELDARFGFGPASHDPLGLVDGAVVDDDDSASSGSPSKLSRQVSMSEELLYVTTTAAKLRLAAATGAGVPDFESSKRHLFS